VFLLQNYSADEHINVGSGTDLSIFELAGIVRDVVGFDGEIVRDLSKPDGTPRKLMDASNLRALGRSPTIELTEGIENTYRWYLAHHC